MNRTINTESKKTNVLKNIITEQSLEFLDLISSELWDAVYSQFICIYYYHLVSPLQLTAKSLVV